MNFLRTNWLAVAVASVAGMAVGFLWYGVIFVQQWMEGNGITTEGEGATMKMFKNGVEVPADGGTPMIFNFVAMVVYALLLSWLLRKSNSYGLQSGAMIGGVVGLIGLIGTHISNMFAMRPHTLSMVDGSYALALFTVMGAVLGLMIKK